MKVKISEAPGGRVVVNFGKILSFFFSCFGFLFSKNREFTTVYSFSNRGENSPQKIIHWFDLIAKIEKKNAMIHNLPRNDLGTAGASF
jgi:hypothetical protein